MQLRALGWTITMAAVLDGEYSEQRVYSLDVV